ncbi:hypothetical protein NDU88_004519 [Pleurodeles waltl]|uniref:Uncharacterized protein n=1 Tax=Pleurodeles waltl TaxID=8319 RepID=A0AAV7WVK7_PLEWA|nr:hypothetical protein NDU88_004519 [Pleurodeles waltl]
MTEPLWASRSGVRCLQAKELAPGSRRAASEPRGAADDDAAPQLSRGRMGAGGHGIKGPLEAAEAGTERGTARRLGREALECGEWAVTEGGSQPGEPRTDCGFSLPPPTCVERRRPPYLRRSCCQTGRPSALKIEDTRRRTETRAAPGRMPEK